MTKKDTKLEIELVNGEAYDEPAPNPDHVDTDAWAAMQANWKEADDE